MIGWLLGDLATKEALRWAESEANRTRAEQWAYPRRYAVTIRGSRKPHIFRRPGFPPSLSDVSAARHGLSFIP